MVIRCLDICLIQQGNESLGLSTQHALKLPPSSSSWCSGIWYISLCSPLSCPSQWEADFNHIPYQALLWNWRRLLSSLPTDDAASPWIMWAVLCGTWAHSVMYLLEMPSSLSRDLFKTQWVKVPANSPHHTILAHRSYDRANFSKPNILHTCLKTKMFLRKCLPQSALPWNLSASNLTKVWGGGGHQGEKSSNCSLQVSYRFCFKISLKI